MTARLPGDPLRKKEVQQPGSLTARRGTTPMTGGRRDSGSRDRSVGFANAGGPRTGLQERQMRKICEQISQKATQKFKTTREALRYVDADRDGHITRSEMRYFFRAYDFSQEVADSFFDRLVLEGHDEVVYEDFVEFVNPSLAGPSLQEPSCGLGKAPAVSGGASNATTRTGTPSDAGVQEQKPDLHAEFRDILELIGQKAAQKFGKLRDAFRFVDGDHDGTISRSEMRYFFRAFNFAGGVADKFHDRLADETTGDVDYSEFVKYMAPYIQPDYVAMPRVPNTRGNTKSSWRAASQGPTRAPSKTVPAEVDPQTVTPQVSPQMCLPMNSSLTAVEPGGVLKTGLQAELRQLMQDIGRKLPLKFKHMRDAFRMLDLERNGRITRTEMRSFFRGFGHPEDVADRVFDLLNDDQHGEISYAGFMSHFDGVLGPRFRLAKRAPLISVDNPKLEKEVNDIAAIIGERLTTKYRNVREAFRALDLNKDGTVSQSEMQMWFRNFGMPIEKADKFFIALDKDHSGTVQYEEFMSLFGAGGQTKEPALRPLLRRLC